MNKRLISLTLAASLLFHTSCIHTDSTEKLSIEVLEIKKVNRQIPSTNKLRIEHLVYSPSKLPLEDFFERAMAGEFREAFKRINLSYKPATSDNKVLERLLDANIIPVYIRATNNEDKIEEMKVSDFTLDDGHLTLRAIHPDDLPTVLESYNVKALGANVYNTGVVLIAVAGIMTAALFLAYSGQSPFPAFSEPFDSDDPQDDLSSGEPRKSRVFNETTKRSEIDYQHFLLKDRKLLPGKKARGLIFFDAGGNDGREFDKGKFKIGFREQY